MRRTWDVVCVLVPARCAACAVDPETAKQEHLVAGNRYMVDKKYSEAMIEYTNAIRLPEARRSADTSCAH